MAAIGAGATACSTDAIIGDWELRSANVPVPDTYAGYSEECGYFELSYDRADVTGDLFVDDDLNADLDVALTLGYALDSEYCNRITGEFGPESRTYSGDIGVLGRGEYTISLRGDDRLRLECDLRGSGDTLRCTDDDDNDLEFRRR